MSHTYPQKFYGIYFQAITKKSLHLVWNGIFHPWEFSNDKKCFGLWMLLS